MKWPHIKFCELKEEGQEDQREYMRLYKLYFIVVVILLMGMKHDQCIYGVKNPSNALRHNIRGGKAVKHTTSSTIEIWFRCWLLTNRILNLWV